MKNFSHSQYFSVFSKAVQVSVFPAKIVVKDFCTHTHTNLVSILQSIAHAPFNIEDIHLIAIDIFTYAAKVKLFFALIEQGYRWIFRELYFPFLLDGDANGEWYLCGQSIV